MQEYPTMPIQKDRPLLRTKRVKFVTRSFSLELYRLASGLFDVPGIAQSRLTDQMADGYFFTMLRDTECDVAINVDEDAFIYDMDAVLDLAEYVLEQGYANAGCPDCGPGCPRGGNPIVTNPFFNIFNLELIRTRWQGKQTLASFDYTKAAAELREQFHVPFELSDPDFKGADYEPYYKFFFWLAQNFKTLYLPSYKHTDGFSTVLLTPDQRRLCAHSWYSRRYKIVQMHTQRINNLVSEVYAQRGLNVPVFTAADQRQFCLDLAKRYVVKCFMRIANWPNKWRKWYRAFRAK